MLPEGKGVVLDINNCTVQGVLPQPDKEAILELVARVKGVSMRVSQITACWDECVVAARVEAGDRLIFLVKTNEGGWKVTAVAIRHA
jgi:hypothetical protein